MPDLLIRLGDRIRKLRKKHGWTQVEFAERVGLDRSFLADVERGKRNISAFERGRGLKWTTAVAQRNVRQQT